MKTKGIQGCRASILLVEDEEGVCLTLADYLSRHGYAVFTYQDSAECLYDLKSNQISPFKIAIIDCSQKRSDSEDLLNYLSQSHFSTPVITISGWPSPFHTATAHFRKPFSPTELEKKIQELLHLS